jgi:hypothetical protein
MLTSLLGGNGRRRAVNVLYMLALVAGSFWLLRGLILFSTVTPGRTSYAELIDRLGQPNETGFYFAISHFPPRNYPPSSATWHRWPLALTVTTNGTDGWVTGSSVGLSRIPVPSPSPPAPAR